MATNTTVELCSVLFLTVLAGGVIGAWLAALAPALSAVFPAPSESEAQTVSPRLLTKGALEVEWAYRYNLLSSAISVRKVRPEALEFALAEANTWFESRDLAIRDQMLPKGELTKEVFALRSLIAQASA